MNLNQSENIRFWSRVRIGHVDECWIWQAAKDRRGYGLFMAKRKHYRSPRVAYELSNGPLRDGEFACHCCDNPSCVNPSHIFSATHKENMRDMAVKKRAATGAHHVSVASPHLIQKGQDHSQAKLTEEQVVAIREMGHTPRQILAAKFGVSPSAISLILKRKTWRHL